jgi:hypothetical protein
LALLSKPMNMPTTELRPPVAKPGTGDRAYLTTAGAIFADLGVPEVLVTVLTASDVVTPFPGPQRQVAKLRATATCW